MLQPSGLTDIRLACFKPGDLPAALSYILEHRGEPSTDSNNVITTTGVGIRGEIIGKIEEKLKLK